MSKEASRTGLEIAVIGMTGRFPGAKDIDQFWNNLKNGVESVSFFSEEELIASGVSPNLVKNPNYVKANGILEDIEYFDSAFFEYTPNESSIMDPQMRIFHESVWKALEDAGYCSDSYKGLIGLYAGASPNFEWEAGSYLSGKGNQTAGIASFLLRDKDLLALRISYKLNLTGPSLMMYTACSTSLVAIHIACQGLLNGECDIALGGGVTVTRFRKEGYIYQEGMILSSDGHCRAFDAKADGTIGGDGAALVVLKRFDDAIADGDTIHAVIKGSAINNDGIRKVGFTAPSVEGQADVIKTALHVAEVDPETVTYIEAHGTGTVLGDPVEIEGLKLAFNTDKKGYCRIGSVKTNMGHLDSVAGVSGFIKTVLALKHKQIPPSINFETPNPKIDFENSPFYVNKTLSAWNGGEYPLRAGISSFGIGGTNAHVILEEAPEFLQDEGSRSTRDYQLIPLSAKTESALRRNMENLTGYLKLNPHINMADSAYTLQVGRRAFQYRKMLVCSNVNEAVELLSDQSERIQSFVLGREDDIKPLIFMFPGQGSQYVDMGLDLYRTENVFRDVMDNCFEILRPIMGYDLKEIIYPSREGGDGTAEIHRTEIAQPVLFVFEYALAKLLIKWGLSPAAMIGHSIGEYAAACISGVLSLKDALNLVAWRGKLMQEMAAGAMLGVPLSEEELQPLLNDEISLAAVNAPLLCTVSGSFEAIDALELKLKEKGHECTRLHTSHAFHSRAMEPILEAFAEKVKAVRLNQPGIPYISNLTGNLITPGEAADSQYWAKQIRNTVRFSEGVNELLKKENPVFLEIGPGKVLSTLVRKHIDKNENRFVLDLVRHPLDKVADDYYLASKIGQLWLWGITIDWTARYEGEKRHRIPLPTYSFDRYRYWFDGNLFAMAQKMFTGEDSLNKKKNMADWFYVPVWKQSTLDIPGANRGSTGSHTLFFMAQNDFGAHLAEKLKQCAGQVTIVKIGSGFIKESDGVYLVNPNDDSDYDKLFKELNQLRSVPDVIVHSWNVTGNNPAGLDFSEIDSIQAVGYHSLINIARSIGKECILDKVQLKVLSDNMQSVTGIEELSPGKSTVLGVVKVIPQEYANISCNSIDIVLPDPGTVQYEKLFDRLIPELMTESGDIVIAYRGIHRWIQLFEPVRLEESPGAPPRLKDGGVYLITGGLGAIGLAMSEYLARTVRAGLILVSRSALNGEEWKARKLQELENLGADVMVLSADVSDREKMQEVVLQAKNRFGHIDGIIHSAGVPDGAMIQRRTRDTSESVFKTKMKGPLVLDAVLNDNKIKPDFIIYCSSLASILSPFGQVGYSAANNFLDSYSHYKTIKDGVFTVSINWDTWKDSGMAVETVSKITMKQGNPDYRSVLSHGIVSSEGQEVFSRILEVSWPQIAVSTRNLNTLIKGLLTARHEGANSADGPDGGKISAVLHPRPAIGATYIAPGSSLEKIIANTWEEVLGLEKVGVNDNFFEVGGDSIKIIELNHKLKTVLNREIPVQIMFSYSTVASLSRYLSQEGMDKGLSEVEIEQAKELDYAKNMMNKTINKIRRR